MIQVPPRAVLSYTRPAVVGFLQRALPSLVGDWTLTSYYRDKAFNRSLPGASPDSQHRIGTALDAAGPPDTLDRIERAAEARGLVVVRRSGYVHLQLFPAGHVRRSGFGWLFDL